METTLKNSLFICVSLNVSVDLVVYVTSFFLSLTSFFLFLTLVLCISIDIVGNKKITLRKKVDLRAVLITRVAEFVEKDPIRGMITSPSKGDVVVSGSIPTFVTLVFSVVELLCFVCCCSR